MSRAILCISVATIAFSVGVATNWSVNALGGLAVDKVYSDATLDWKTVTILPGPRSASLPVTSCRQLFVSVTPNGTLNLNSMPTGTLNDTSALSAMLTRIFEQREQLRVAYMNSIELSSRVPEDWQIDKTVYIKAPRNMSYGEVADLIAVVKDAGAEPVGLIADRYSPQP